MNFSFGDIFLQLGFFIFRGMHIDATSKGPKGVDFLSLGFIFLNWILNCIMFCKIIGKPYHGTRHMEKVLYKSWIQLSYPV